jgi:ribosomal protein S18 acetylase RimI-like enzyme
MVRLHALPTAPAASVASVSAVPTVVPLDPSDRARAGECLARAFQDDPVWAGVFPDPARRAVALSAMFRALVRVHACYGRPLTTAQLSGVALWRPPGAAPGLVDTLRTRAALPRVVARLGAAERHRMMRTLRQFAGRRTTLVPEPHWYLEAIGVEPEKQGSGVGTALVTEVLGQADAHRTPCYLETETEANVRFYTRLGFEVAEEHVADALGVPVWLMTRRPRAAGQP